VESEAFIYGLEDAEGSVPCLEGFEASKGVDPVADGAVETFWEVVAHREFLPSLVPLLL